MLNDCLTCDCFVIFDQIPDKADMVRMGRSGLL